MPNHLASERSPYLLQHANNPVDWYPWGEAAFARARSADLPIFLSIGYSTCHWCHVMAHESFEDADVAAVLNEHFVAVKLDREERPDIDRVYMMFVQATTGAGGWPMSVWLTPDLQPFFGGTYFPPVSRWGRPGFVDVLRRLAEAWRTDRAAIVEAAVETLDRLRETSGTGAMAPGHATVATRDALATGVEVFAREFDARHGGTDGAPKFPRPSEVLFLLHAHALTGQPAALEMAVTTLRAMSRGGIRDHVGGGFHRYAVDAEWRVPHFEKMLYDQAQLVLAYLEATQATGDVCYATVAEDTLDYVLRDMTAPGGAFYSAEDADAVVPAAGDGSGQQGDMREGAFYVWTKGELVRLLGDDEPIYSRRFGIEPRGNALADPMGEFEGQNIPYVARSIEDVAAWSGTSGEVVTNALARARRVLFEARASRPRPRRDDKILTAWNGLMIAAFARAARVLVASPRRNEWRRAAERAAAWIESELWLPARRRLLRRHRDGESAIAGCCEDYACLTWGLLELFQSTGNARWLRSAAAITRSQVDLFFDARDGGWFSTTGEDRSVLLRVKDDHDGAEPAAASVTVRNLITLGRLLGDPEFDDLAGRTLGRYGPHLGRAARAIPLMAANLALWHGGDTQIVVAGRFDDDATRALETAVASHYLPWAVTVPVPSPADAAELARLIPWVGGMGAAAAPTARLCDNFACQAAEHDPAAFAAALDRAAARARQVSPSRGGAGAASAYTAE
jgi:uncharacterized protein YyaL (SSP411 family)